MTRLRRLIDTALVDSFGLSLGWTVFSLHVVRGHGLAGLGLCNAAMLVGVALSAPVATRPAQATTVVEVINPMIRLAMVSTVGGSPSRCPTSANPAPIR